MDKMRLAREVPREGTRLMADMTKAFVFVFILDVRGNALQLVIRC